MHNVLHLNKLEYILIFSALFVLTATLSSLNNNVAIPYFNCYIEKIDFFVWCLIFAPLILAIGNKSITHLLEIQISSRYDSKKRLLLDMIKELTHITVYMFLIIIFFIIIAINFFSNYYISASNNENCMKINNFLYVVITYVKYFFLIYSMQLLQLYLHLKVKPKTQIIIIILILLFSYSSLYFDMPFNLYYLSPATNTCDYFYFNDLKQSILVSLLYYFNILLIINILLFSCIKKTNLIKRSYYE